MDIQDLKKNKLEKYQQKRSNEGKWTMIVCTGFVTSFHNLGLQQTTPIVYFCISTSKANHKFTNSAATPAQSDVRVFI